MKVLEFIFANGWHFFGFLVLLFIASHWRLISIIIDKSVDNSVDNSTNDNSN